MSRTLNALAPGTKVPALTGKRLSDANSQLIRIGFAQQSVRATDGSDQQRSVFNYDNWFVDAQQPAAGTAADAHTIVTFTVTKPTDGRGDRTASPGVVPNVTCKDLDSAGGLVRTAGFTIHAVDATGGNRSIIVHQNWVVVGQSAAPRSTPDKSTRIELKVVKYTEPPGSSGCRT